VGSIQSRRPLSHRDGDGGSPGWVWAGSGTSRRWRARLGLELQVLAVTAYAAPRIAFSIVNDPLGVRPEPELVDLAPEAVRAVVTFGRPAWS